MARRILALVAFVLSSPGNAQQIVLSGTVSATDGAPLRGVTIHLVDTQVRALTDADGKYSLSVPVDGVVAFTLAGRRPRQQQVLGRTTIDATMELDPFWTRAVFPGTPVRVTTAARTYEGNFVHLAGERFVVELPTTVDSIAVRDISAMWKSVPAVERGARIGLAVGALAGGIIAHRETGKTRRTCLLKDLCGSGARATYVVFSAAIAGAGGAVVGAALGRSFAVWDRIQP